MEKLKGQIYSAYPVQGDGLRLLEEKFSKKYGQPVTLEWVQDDEILAGFKVEILNIDQAPRKTYDYSLSGQLEQLNRELIAEVDANDADLSQTLKNRIADYAPRATERDTGYVITAGDGVQRISGLRSVKYGELLAFEGDAYGMALNLTEDEVSAVLLTNADQVGEGTKVYATGQVMDVPVGENMIGRIVSPLGLPLDGKGPIKTDKRRPIETPAPGIMDRQSVKTPLQTGLVGIDSMIPIGRGQRELIIGDRQTGKTAIAIDTILNQKGQDVICIYVAIGQKASSVAQLAGQLEAAGAMDYTMIVSSCASDPAPMQYIAPYAGCAMAEEFMYAGKDVLIVYDDLSKHAVAYRTMSLLLRRPPGREAYPGDVFYLHSRLLERAARLSPEKGGGSITALPIIETMAGDISAYIPTNVISITDGQIFLESELFHAGVRPAVNVGLSVSRVGGSAQCKAMRKVAGQLRIDLAQYRELAVFAQFGSDLDRSTQEMLAYGERLTEVLKQDQYQPLTVAQQVAVLYIVSHRMLMQVPVNRIREFCKAYLERLGVQQKDALQSVMDTGDLSEAATAAFEDTAHELLIQWGIEEKRA